MTTKMFKANQKKKLGLYIHIPFCKQKCAYCDFCSVAGADSELVEKYLVSLKGQISSFAEACREYEVDTIYIGGGTPTALKSSELVSLVDRCIADYSIASDVEISCECNPATASREYFFDIRSAGINRLSVGLQSIHENELTRLGRIHSYKDFLNTLSDARDAGFDNISADLMYGIPEQTIVSFEKTLRALSELSPEHISAYCLKVEPNTRFGKMGDSLVLPDDDLQYEMYLKCSEILSLYGYEKYEISNFAKPSRESRHNLRYWLGEEYLGFGAAAHSYFLGERFAQSANITSFANGEFCESERERISDREKMYEYVMLRMRLACGVDLSEFEKLFGVSFVEKFPTVKKYVQNGFIILDNDKCCFSNKGFFVSSYILSEMLDFN